MDYTLRGLKIVENAYVLQLRKPKSQELFLCFCGVSECAPNHSFGPVVRPNHIIHYILHGKGFFEVAEKRYELGAGQGFLIEPEAVTYYQADSRDPWSYLWIGFAGDRAADYMRDLGLGDGQLSFSCKQGEKLQEIVAAMLEINKSSLAGSYRLQSLLYHFFAVLAEEIGQTPVPGKVQENLYVEQAVRFIRNNYTRNIRVKDIAAYVRVNRSYLYKLFEENLHASPQAFLTSFRIARSRELLELTELSIEGVALSCGYQDALVFSKAFKKQLGLPPSVYRRTKRQELKNRLLQDKDNAKRILRSGKC